MDTTDNIIIIEAMVDMVVMEIMAIHGIAIMTETINTTLMGSITIMILQKIETGGITLSVTTAKMA